MEWYLSDHLGSTTLLINESGLEVERTEYYPYGEVQSGGLEKYGFTGKENDADTELMYYGARYYSPEYRIFVQPDTMIPDPYNPQALNRYSYCLNNPVKYNDPSGHYVETALDLAFIALDVAEVYNNPSDKWAWAALGADVVCAALPLATGGGLAVKGLKAATELDKAADAGRIIEKGSEAENVGDLFGLMDKTFDAETKIDNIYYAAKSTEGLADGITILKKPSPILGDNVRRTLNYDGKNIQINTGHGYRSDHPAGGM